MAQETRKLTEKEVNRRDNFEKFKSELEQKGYQCKDILIDTQRAQRSGVLILVMLPFMALIFWIYNHVNGFDLDCLSWEFGVAAFLLIPCLAVAHELIHGITWGIFAKTHWRSIDFGMIWSSFSPYCTCSKPLKKWQYLLGTAMPTLVLGGGLGAAAVISNQLLLFLLAEYMTLSGGGDFLIVLKCALYHSDQRETVYRDHPYECGCVVFEK